MKFRWVIALLCLTGLLLSEAMPDNRAIGPGSVSVITSQPGSASYESAVMASKDDYSGRQWAVQRIMAPEAWEITSGDAGVIIAVLDSGIDQAHEDLAGKVVSQVNFTDSPTDDDIYGHGTHIAGIIAAVVNNGIGITGLAYDSSLMNVKVVGDNGELDCAVAARGIVWAVDHGARVINVSLVSTSPSPILEEAVDYAWSRGAVVVAAAGNYIGKKVAYPASYANCIAVAATDSGDSVTQWSGCGDWVDVAAPGVDIYSTLPGNEYGSKSGTSMSAAYVSGLAALLFSVARDANGDGFLNDEVRAAIENSCDVVSAGSIKGRINVYNAIRTAVSF